MLLNFKQCLNNHFRTRPLVLELIRFMILQFSYFLVPYIYMVSVCTLPQINKRVQLPVNNCIAQPSPVKRNGDCAQPYFHLIRSSGGRSPPVKVSSRLLKIIIVPPLHLNEPRVKIGSRLQIVQVFKQLKVLNG